VELDCVKEGWPEILGLTDSVPVLDAKEDAESVPLRLEVTVWLTLPLAV
jgi:hypothetical protein